MEQRTPYGYAPAVGLRSESLVDRRARFIARTYNHLFWAIVAFIALEIALFMTGAAAVLARAMLGTSWLLVLGAFMLASWLASRWAHTSTSRSLQYAGLATMVVAYAILFLPLLVVAEHYAKGTIQSAGIVSLAGFGGLTAIVMVTKKDFSFLRGVLFWGGLCALLMIVAGAIFGFQLGTLFSVVMVAFAGAAILYDTSNVLHHFPEDRYVGAALELFASVALLFWYVLRIFLAARD